MMQAQPTPRKASGPAIAAMYAVALGMLAMAVANVFTEASAPAKEFVQAIGKAWIPGAQSIGPYSGKETILLVVWLVSWLALHFLLRRRDLPIKPFAIGFLVAVGVATTLLWPPVFTLLAGA